MCPARDDLQHQLQLQLQLQHEQVPHLKDTILLKPPDQYWLYDAKFYPYTTTASDPIFASASIRHVFVYRICHHGNQDIHLIQKIEDEDKDARISSLAWSKDLETGAPLLCVAGDNAKIKIRDARTGALRMTLIGHGGVSAISIRQGFRTLTDNNEDVNDLAVSPTNPEILASASADNTLRIWSLSSSNKTQPCAILCAGEGHLDTVLSVAFHGTGRYILSGGQDHIVNLWALPEISHDYVGAQKPIVVHFPHFSTSEVHSNIVDCVAFHGDLILSKAFNEHCIVLWQITGFDSSTSFPDPTSAPAKYSNKCKTRSAFSTSSGTSKESKAYVRLLQFDVPGCLQFYMRFSLSSSLSGAATHPILAICNSRSKVFFWDLSRLAEYHTYTTSLSDPTQNSAYHPPLAPPPWLAAPSRAKEQQHQKKNNPRQSSSDASTTRASSPSSPLPSTPPPAPPSRSPAATPPASAKRKYALTDPLQVLEAHHTVRVPAPSFDGRQVAWSVCGTWCVVVATWNAVVVLRR